MSALTEKPRYTAAQLEALPDEKRYELVNGELVERNMGNESSQIGMKLFGLIYLFAVGKRLGVFVGPDGGFTCFKDDSDKLRRPDLAFIRSGRLPGDKAPTGWISIPPDLAVEVVSPNDLAYEVDKKVGEYLEAGVKLVWVVHPEGQHVEIHRADGTSLILKAKDELSGEDVLPGFRCKVEELFQGI